MENIKKEFGRVSVENNLGLTDIEIEITVWLESGYSQAEIAEYLGCNQATVSRKCTQIKNKCIKRATFCPIVYRGINEIE